MTGALLLVVAVLLGVLWARGARRRAYRRTEAAVAPWLKQWFAQVEAAAAERRRVMLLGVAEVVHRRVALSIFAEQVRTIKAGQLTELGGLLAAVVPCPTCQQLFNGELPSVNRKELHSCHETVVHEVFYRAEDASYWRVLYRRSTLGETNELQDGRAHILRVPGSPELAQAWILRASERFMRLGARE